MNYLQQKLIVVCKSYNQSVYFVLIAFMFYLIVRKTSLILMFSTQKKTVLYVLLFGLRKSPCLSVFSVLTSCFATSVLPFPLPWSSLNLLVTEKFWKKKAEKMFDIYHTEFCICVEKLKFGTNYQLPLQMLLWKHDLSDKIWKHPLVVHEVRSKHDLSLKIWSQLSIVNSFRLKDFSIRYPTEKWSEQNKSAIRKYCTVSKFSKLTPPQKKKNKQKKILQ